mgnify:CR=1 FL=1
MSYYKNVINLINITVRQAQTPIAEQHTSFVGS